MEFWEWKKNGDIINNADSKKSVLARNRQESYAAFEGILKVSVKMHKWKLNERTMLKHEMN